ncbi:MAG: metal ABC transporter permease [Deltaproteobacteria bacterium]|nr:metal ABC transporter permease [Deltaproteobacteria bacterium]
MPPETPAGLGQFFDAWELFRDPALAGVVAGALLGFLGVFVVARRMVFLSAALSQAAGLGVAAAFWAQIHLGLSGTWLGPTVGSTVATGLAALYLVGGTRGARWRPDGRLGWVYLMGAAGTLALGTRIVQEVQDIETILFGSAVAVAPADLHQLLVVASVLLALQLVGLRGFAQVAVDEDGARVRGLPTGLLGLLLVASLALAVSVTTRILGALPVFAFTVLPAMAALRVAPNLATAAWLAAVLGGAAGFLGYLAAFLFTLPVGAAQALVAGAEVLLTALVGLALDAWHVRAVHRHAHIHGPGCGHLAVQHGDHVDYLHDGHLDHQGRDGHHAGEHDPPHHH